VLIVADFGRAALLASVPLTYFAGTLTIWQLYVVGLGAGVLGTIYAVGGISSLGGALIATRVTRLIGIGPVIVLGLLAYGIVSYLIPLARGPAIVGRLHGRPAARR